MAIEKTPNVPPFVSYCAQLIPTVFDNSLSYYEALAALAKWMQDNLVDVINNNAAVTEEYIRMTEELKAYVENYFANLDVQEEINNKLDQMVEDGTLQEIITTYIQANVAWTFDTVSDMKLATNLVDGSYARTLGFDSVNDGGGALYHISNSGTANEMDVIAVGSLYANLAEGKLLNARMFGCKGDGSTDDTAKLQRAIDYTSTVKGKLIISDGTYMVNALTNLFLKSNVNLEFINAKIKAIANDQTTYNVLSIIDCENCVITNAVIEGEKEEHTGSGGEFGYGVNIIGDTSNIVFDNLTVNDCWGDGVFIYRKRVGSIDYWPDGIYFNGTTKISNCRRQGVSIISGENIFFDSLICKNIYGTYPCAGVDIEPNGSADIVGNVNINYLETDGCIKGFTMRMNAELIGNVTIGTIYHHNQRTKYEGLEGRYEGAFRVFFDYYKAGASAHYVSVDTVISDHGRPEFENIYNDITPQVIVGNYYVKEVEIVGTASPAEVERCLVNIRYTTSPTTSTSLGGLKIEQITCDRVSSLTGSNVNNMVDFDVYYGGEVSKSTLVYENVRIGNIDILTKTSQINYDNNSNRSNILCNNIKVGSANIGDIYNRRDSGTFNCITSGAHNIYFLPLTNSSASKTIQLRPRNCLQPFTLKCVGNSTVTINTAHQSSYFTKVYLNDSEITGADNMYSIGTFADGAEFNIHSEGSSIYLQQIS